jgi:hypothetical protein
MLDMKRKNFQTRRAVGEALAACALFALPTRQAMGKEATAGARQIFDKQLTAIEREVIEGRFRPRP